MAIQDNKEYVFTGAQLKQLKTYIDDAGGGGAQSDYDEYDSTAQDYIRNRKFYDKTPYFVYGEATGKYQYFYDSNNNLNYPFNQLPTINGITFDPKIGDYMYEILGGHNRYADFQEAGAAADKAIPYWDSSLVEATHATYPLKVTEWIYDDRTRTLDMTKYSAVADDGETVYLFIGGNVHVLVYKSLMIQLVPPYSHSDQDWNKFMPSVIVQSRVAQEVVEIPERFLPKASADKAGIVKTSDFVASAGEGLVKESASLKVKAGLADYEENDSTKASYIQNRPFYEATSTEQQSIIEGTIPSYSSDNQNSMSNGAWTLLSETLAQDTENRNIQLDTGALYSYVTAETKAAIIAKLGSSEPITFGNIGGTWTEEMSETEHVSYFTFVATSYSQLTNGVYALEGAVTSTNVSTPKAAVLYMGATSDVCADGNDWLANMFSQYMPDGMVLCANNLNVEANVGGELPQFTPSTVWTISVEAEVSVLKQLDPKYLNTTGLILNGGTSAPTTSTVGAVGTLYSYVDATVPHLMVCTAVDTSVAPNTYPWVDVMGSVASALNQVNNGGN